MRLLPITTLLTMYRARSEMKLAAAINASIAAEAAKQTLTKSQLSWDLATMNMTYGKTLANKLYTMGLIQANAATGALVLTTKGLMMALGGAAILFAGAVMSSGKLSDAFTVLASIMATIAAFSAIKSVLSYFGATMGPFAIPVAMAAGAAVLTGMFKARDAIQQHFGVGDYGGGPATIDLSSMSAMPEQRLYDGGGMFVTPMYDNGGPTTEHGLAILQKGETVIPKTQNMLDSGITINMGDVNVQDGEDFAQRVAEALPSALRRQNDIGGI